MWLAVPAALLLGDDWRERAWLWPAFSAAAILLERVTKKGSDPVGASYIED
jgi:hypothetical protein